MRQTCRKLKKNYCAGRPAHIVNAPICRRKGGPTYDDAFAIRRQGQNDPTDIDICQAGRAIGFHARPAVLDVVIPTVRQTEYLTVELGEGVALIGTHAGILASVHGVPNPSALGQAPRELKLSIPSLTN